MAHIKRSLTKTLTWRIVASADTFLISWIITGEIYFAGVIAGIEVLTKMFLYYSHERVWERIKWGKKLREQHTTIFPHGLRIKKIFKKKKSNKKK